MINSAFVFFILSTNNNSFFVFAPRITVVFFLFLVHSLRTGISGAMPTPPAIMQISLPFMLKPLPYGPRIPILPFFNACIFPVNSPTFFTVMQNGFLLLKLNGFSSMPGSHNMKNCPGLTSNSLSRTKLFIVGVSFFTFKIFAISGTLLGFQSLFPPVPNFILRALCRLAA